MYKGIILAGGQGTRLYPSSKVVSKQLMNVYDKPLIYYPISTLMLAGIKDILIITNPEYVNQFQELLGDGSQWGIDLRYKIQEEPNGIAEALIIGEEFIGEDNVCLILGDNILYGNYLENILKDCCDGEGATILAYPVTDPERFGVVEFEGNKVISIEEKPKNPKSNRAVIGVYFYNNKASEYAKKVVPSARGEVEITSLHNIYLEKGNLKVTQLNRGITWIDAGTFDSLLMASNFISTVEKVQSYKISCPEEIAYRNKWIDNIQLKKLAEPLLKSGYGKYLHTICEQRK
jgi:glucose-1-phosphate thymidylyltransferase